MSARATSLPRVLIAGGGFSGTCAAIHLLRQCERPLDIVVVEPASRLGGGLAHSSSDPDHRLNAPAAVHVVRPDVPGQLENWLIVEGRVQRDPEARCDGALYPRRSDFGDYVRAQLDEAAQKSISCLHRLQARATGIGCAGGRFRLVLDSGMTLDGDGCIVATGHERPSVPAWIPPDVAASPCYLNDPWSLDALEGLGHRGDVLLIGTGLTAADVIATLSSRNHAGRITALSRHGYRPAGQNPSPSSRSIWDAVNDPLPDFVARHGTPARVSDVLRILRASIAADAREGRTWHGAFDEVRNAARQLWGALAPPEKRRFLRHARALYDAHRFRIAPQTGHILERELASGRLTFDAGRIHSVCSAREGLDVEHLPRAARRSVRKRFGAIVNCTGPENRPRSSPNPLIRSLLEAGLAREDEAGLGLATDRDCQALGANGKPVPGLYCIGPLSRGLIGETPAVPVITWEVLGLAPRLLAGLHARR